jgi:hypothetical protein
VELRQRIVERRGPILDRWFEALVASYPAGAREFLGRRGNPFANPVGATARRALAGILDGLLTEGEPAAVHAPLEELLRVRAVQDFSPSQAVAFVFALKRVLRDDAAAAALDDVPAAQWSLWDERIDALALSAFDAYVKFREQIYELRSTEWKNRMFRLLQRAKLVCGVEGPDDEPIRPEDRAPDADDEKPSGGS